jgi:hypothetical protein
VAEFLTLGARRCRSQIASSLKYVNCGLKRVTPNLALKRTRTGMPLQAFISFLAFSVLPARAA